MPYRHIAKEIIMIVSLSLVVAFGVNSVSPKRIALFGRWDTSKGVISAVTQGDVIEPDIEIRDSREAKKLFDGTDAVFVDARAKSSYEESHIAGAVSLPVNRFDELLDHFYNTYALNRLIVTYCSGRECDDSHELAQYLKEAGYEKVLVYIDGMTGWEEGGFPVE